MKIPEAIGIRAPMRGTIAVDALAARMSPAANGRKATPAFRAEHLTDAVSSMSWS
jgi:hypothetical protein